MSNPKSIDLAHLKKILPQLIRENDEIKGAIISALSGVVSTKEDIENVIAEMDKRFEAMYTRFEKRSEAMDARFEKRSEAMDKRFENMDKRFEEMLQAFKDQFAAQNEMIKGVQLGLARIESKEGIAIERLTRDLLKTVLKMKNINPDSISTVSIVDKEGDIFYKNYRSEIDIFKENGDLCIIEMKARASKYDIYMLLQKAKLYELIHKKTPSKLILAAIRVNSDTIREAKAQNIELVWGEILDL